MADLEALSPKDLSHFADQLVLSWAPRDRMIMRIGRIRSQNWVVDLPPAVKLTTKTQHSSIPFDISSRSVGILTAQMPVYERIPPDDDETSAVQANTVQRYCQGRLEWDRAYATPGRDAWVFLTDELANKGAAVVGSIYAPHAYASAPPLWGKDGDYAKTLWRDKGGKATTDKTALDPVATSNYYRKVVEYYRLGARPPIVHRYIPTEQCYPAYLGDEMAAMVIRRRASLLELDACGFDMTDLGASQHDDTVVTRTLFLTEVWTPNRCQYFVNDTPLRHRAYGVAGIDTHYGFVPFEYRAGLPGTLDTNRLETDYGIGPVGLPLLALVESNIVMIDSLLTFRYSAIQGFSYPAWQIVRQMAQDTVVALAAGEPKTYKIEPNMAVDFGPGVKLEALMNPGLNKDFDKAIEDERTEVRKIIPDPLAGIPASSGYNSAVMSQQARAFFNPIIDAQQHLAKSLAVMDMRHISDRPGLGKIYAEYRYQDNALDATPSRMRRVSIEASDIGGYHGIHAEIGRELDRVTMGTWAAGMVDKGLMAKETAAKMCGVTDWEHEEQMMARDRFMAKPEIQAVVEADAVKDFGLQNEQEAAAAQARIQMQPDGTPAVMPPPGASPMGAPPTAMGQPQTPQGQAMNGAILGGANMNSAGPNMASSFNPNIQQPTPAQPARMRRRGGAIPGAPQNQGGAKITGFGP